MILKWRIVMAACLIVTSVRSFANEASTCFDLFNTDDAAATGAIFDPNRKSPVAPKPLPVRVVKNLYRWYFKRDTRDLNPQAETYDALNDFDYLREKRVTDKIGNVRSVFSKELDTRIYFTATGTPNANGEIPVVDPNARALYFYFHGSGTDKASGVNFAYKMNKMAALGYAVVSIDLPYHADGSRNRRMNDANYFYAMINQLIETYRVPGMPIYLAGHSFGPDVIAEYAKRYPFGVNGLAMFSPGSITKEMEDWFINHTAHMTALWGETVSNDDGANWAGIVSSSGTWKTAPTPENPDPTTVNPNLNVRIVTGEWEEYAPGELDDRGLPTKKKRDYDVCKALLILLPRAKCILEPRVGHYIFEHLDEKGHDVILRELLALDNQDLDHEKELKATAKSNHLSFSLELSRRYVRDPFFREYVNATLGGETFVAKLVADNDDSQASRVLNFFGRYIVAQRERALIANIQSTIKWNPSFYNENKAAIDALAAKNPQLTDSLVNHYFALIETMSPEQRAQYIMVDPSVMKLPERQGPTPEMLERQRLIDEERKLKKEAAKQKAS